MKIRLFLACFSLFVASGAVAAPQDDATEPPAQYQLHLNGKPIPMTLDKEISLDRRAGRTRLMISRGATRRFDKGGVAFDYPSDYGFEAELGAKIAVWTLSGRASILMLQRFPLSGPALLRERVTREMVAQFGRKNVVISPAALLLGGRTIEGKRLQVSLAKQVLVQEIFAFSTARHAYVLMVQDAPQAGKETAEMRGLKALLAKSASF